MSQQTKQSNSQSLKSYCDFMEKNPTFNREENDKHAKIYWEGKQAKLKRENGDSDPSLDEIIERGMKSRQLLIERNIALAVREFRKMNNGYINHDDTIQRLMEALIYHIDCFDPTKGFALSTYCLGTMLHHATRRAGQEEREVRIPVHMLADVSKVWNVMRHHDIQYSTVNQMQFEFIKAELAKQELSFDDDKLYKLIQYAAFVTISDAVPIGSDDDGDHFGVYSTLEAEFLDIQQLESKMDADRLMKQIKPAQALSIALNRGLYGRQLSLREMADNLGTTYQNHDQRIKHGMARLRQHVMATASERLRRELEELEKRNARSN